MSELKTEAEWAYAKIESVLKMAKEDGRPLSKTGRDLVRLCEFFRRTSPDSVSEEEKEAVERGCGDIIIGRQWTVAEHDRLTLAALSSAPTAGRGE